MKAVISNKARDGGLSEIYQSQNTQQALLRKTGEGKFDRISAYVKCRDFLVDSYSFAKENKDFVIYGFTFHGSKEQPDWSGANLQMHFHDDQSRQNVLDNIKLLHAIEKKNKIPLTELLEVEGSRDFVAQGHKRWLSNALYFSLYSLLLRIMCYKLDHKDWIEQFSREKHSDSKYIQSVPRKTLLAVFDDLSILDMPTFCGFDPKTTAVHTIHHNGGFISVFGSHREINDSLVRQNTHWQAMTRKGYELRLMK